MHTAGGDFETTAGASTDVTGPGVYTWAGSDALVSDVQMWLDMPSVSFGWLLQGDESDDRSAKRFNTREHPDSASHPARVIEYMPSAEADHDVFLPIAYVPPVP